MLDILDYFEDTCKKYPNKDAIICDNKRIKYNELYDVARKVGSYIQQYININDPVIVFMNKGIDTVESFLGILYSGGCYCLLNPELPLERINTIFETLDSKVIITNKFFLKKAKETFKGKIIVDIGEINEKTQDNVLLKIKNNKIDLDSVYINFTSGSTGVPKGVVVSNRSIIDFINIFTEKFCISNNDIIANQAPFDFDVSVKDIYSCLFKGATLLIVPKEYFSTPSILLDYLIENNATTLIWAVSALCLITTFHGLDYKIPEKVNKIIFSGEVMPVKHLNIWLKKLPKTTFINVYGPTEITCNCTYHIIDRNRNYDDYIPIGIPFKNERVFLLDDNKKEIKEKDKMGEICVSGSCLSLGYYNNDFQNKKYFCQNPVNDKYYDRIYKTGDYGKYNSDFELVFCGRKDFQIKYMGHRIELEEIEKEIMKFELIRRCVCIYDDIKQKLFCFYIGDMDNKDLKIQLLNKLPIYMVPTKIVNVSVFPLNKNGKIDRKEILRKYYDKSL